MIPLQHARELDNFLIEHPSRWSAQRSEWEAQCDVVVARRYAKFSCGSQRPATTGDFSMVVSVYLDDGRVTGASVAGLTLEGQFWRSSLDLPSAEVEKTPEGWKIVSRVLQPFTGLSARRADGARLERLTLTWTDQGSSDPAGAPSTARVTMSSINDFELIERALEQLEQGARDGQHDLFSRGAFRPARLKTRLMSLPGQPLGHECCADPAMLPPIELDEVAEMSPETLDSALFSTVPIRGFAQLCGDCHQGAGDHPPSFLHGNASSILSRLQTCSQRIWMRLRMWGLPPGQRPKSPMPPVNALAWLGAGDASELVQILDTLEQYAEAVVREQLAPEREPDDLFAAGYRNAVECRTANP